jgi:outer membrane protein assembly factor BamB
VRLDFGYGSLRAYDLADGRAVWEQKPPGGVGNYYQTRLPRAWGDALLLFDEQRVNALDISNGARRWSLQITASEYTSFERTCLNSLLAAVDPEGRLWVAVDEGWAGLE